MNPNDFRIHTALYFSFSDEELIRHGYRTSELPENKPTETCTNFRVVDCDQHRSTK